MDNIGKEILKFKLLTGIEMKVDESGVLNWLWIPESCTLHTLEFPSFIKSISLDASEYLWDTDTIQKVIFPKELETCYIEGGITGAKHLVFGTVKEFIDGIASCLNTLETIEFDSAGGIGTESFAYCESLKEFDFSKVVRVVEAEAFMNCKGMKTLKNIDECDNVTFGDNCFDSCTGLTSLHLAGNCQFGYKCFSDCTGLKNITVEDGVVLRSYCFHNCRSLEHVVIKNFELLAGIDGLVTFNKNVKFEVYNIGGTHIDDVCHTLGAKVDSLTIHRDRY